MFFIYLFISASYVSIDILFCANVVVLFTSVFVCTGHTKSLREKSSKSLRKSSLNHRYMCVYDWNLHSTSLILVVFFLHDVIYSPGFSTLLGPVHDLPTWTLREHCKGHRGPLDQVPQPFSSLNSFEVTSVHNRNLAWLHPAASTDWNCTPLSWLASWALLVYIRHSKYHSVQNVTIFNLTPFDPFGYGILWWPWGLWWALNLSES